MLKWFKRFKRSEKGQGMVEYGLILALVSIVAIGALGGIGGKLSDTFDKVVEVIPEGEKVDDLVADGYIPIATPEELDSLRKDEAQIFGQGTKWEEVYTSGLDKNYILVSDLDLSGIPNFEPIGTYGNEFEGIFDGGGYAISNLKINRGSEDYVGLFGYAEGASFKNIGLEDVNVTGTSRVGGLVGRQNSSTITSSYATGTVTGSGDYVGGLVGYQYDSSKVISSYAKGNVTGTANRVGGLVGYQTSSSTTNSYATGNVTGNSQVGGLVGRQDDSSTVTNSYSTGNVTGNSQVGGLVGYHYNSSTTSSYYDKETTGQEISDTGEGTGKTSDEMKNKDTYVDWDFESIWKIENNQYPTHR